MPPSHVSTVCVWSALASLQGFSEVLSFVSAPTAEVRSAKILVIGDWGYGQNGKAIPTRNLLETLKQQVVVVPLCLALGCTPTRPHAPALSGPFPAAHCLYWIADTTCAH